MKEKKDQFIIAYITDFEKTETVLSYSLWLATLLQKGLILTHICDPRYSSLSPDEAEKKLKDLKRKLDAHEDEERASGSFDSEAEKKVLKGVPADIPAGINISYAALKGDSRQIITALPTLLSAVAIVAQVVPHARRRNAMSRRALLRNFAECKTAFLVAQKPLTDAKALTDIAMAIDFKKESKDKIIWSSYFPRFGNLNMHVLYYDYKDQFLHSKWYANMTQLHKLYSGLNISFKPHIIKSKSTFLDINALGYAAENHYGMLISVTTKEKDGLEFFIGVQEKRTIVNREGLPILFLNPREDLYVLCD